MADRELLDGWVITLEGDTAKIVSPPTGPGFAVVCQHARALPERLLFALAESLVRACSAHPQQAAPVQSAAGVDAYDMIDRFLRNNLRDDDYAEYSAALDSLYTAPQQQAEPTRSQRLADAGFTRRPSLWALQARQALELIAAPQRPDGTWNRDRAACRQIAAEALGRYDDE